jgi:tetratricopeptide (TPR) repeat protein
MQGIELLARFSIIFLFFPGLLTCQIFPIVEVDSLLRSGIDKIISQDYRGAEKVFLSLNSKYPDLPLGEIYLAANEITESVDLAVELNENFVDSLLSEAMEKTELLLDKDDESLWNNYYEALIHGYKAYYHSITGNLISAFADGVLSLRAFQICIELNENFHEAYIALGTYNYWKSAQSESFLWLPFVEDNRNEGIELLEKSIRNFSYNKHLAAYSLIWIYIDYQKIEKAANLAEQMLLQYPNSRFFRWALARAYQDLDKEKAIKVFNEILNSLETLPFDNGFNKIVLKHKIAMLYYEMGNYQIVLKFCDEILDFKIKSDEIRKKLSDRIERTKALRETALDKLNN